MPRKSVKLHAITTVDEPGDSRSSTRIVVRDETGNALKLDAPNGRDREALADAIRVRITQDAIRVKFVGKRARASERAPGSRLAQAAARRARSPDLASTIERERAAHKQERKRRTNLREIYESAEQRRKTNANMRDTLRDKYALPGGGGVRR